MQTFHSHNEAIINLLKTVFPNFNFLYGENKSFELFTTTAGFVKSGTVCINEIGQVNEGLQISWEYEIYITGISDNKIILNELERTVNNYEGYELVNHYVTRKFYINRITGVSDDNENPVIIGIEDNI